MTFICPVCTVLPFSHSLVKLGVTKGIVYYYTCPSQALLYYDVEGIVHHYNGVLSEIPKEMEWIWIFDSEGFNLIHALQIKVAVELAKLISNKFSVNLKKIIIINPTLYIRMTHTFLLPFLNETLQNRIELYYEYTTPQEIMYKTSI
uniref:CRAL-TRIO domain-containing protein n=1 Tax=viral metagenome TaxID=1070528 RepID=A0A6C0JWP9_9ZZZZ